jgi:hypothetical protein
MSWRWRDLDPRRWSRGRCAFAVLLGSSIGAASWTAPAVLDRWEAARAARRFDEVALPRVASDLSPLYPGARLRVTNDRVDLDFRARTAALPESARRRVVDAVEPLWRDALLVESRALVCLRDGRLREDERRPARNALADRWLMARRALDEVTNDELAYEARAAPVLFVDARVPMATLRELWLGLATDVALALRGPHGVTVLPIWSRICAPIPSVELDVSAERFVLRTSTQPNGCIRRTGDPKWRETTITRDGVDRGARRLREALATAPWALDTADTAEHDNREFYLRGAEPWGAIALRIDEDLPFADFVATAMIVRDRSPGSCHDARPEGCLYPLLTVGIPSRAARVERRGS